MVTKFRLVCNYFYLSDIYSALFMFALLFGSIIFGVAADNFGRIPALMLAIGTTCLSSVISAFMPTAAGYGFFRWLTGIGGMGSYLIAAVLVLEYVSNSYNTLVGVLIPIPFSIGGLLLALDAYLIRDWVTLQLVSHAPWLILLLLWLVVPESPRWLIASVYQEKAVKVIKKMAEGNGKSVPDCLLYPSIQTKEKIVVHF